MEVIRDLSKLNAFLKNNSCQIGCLADTGFLYALSYDDDRCYEKASDVFDLLAETNVPIYANVISRMEFIDLIFRKQVTNGCIELYQDTIKSFASPIINTLKDIRDQNTASKRQGQSYKIDERKLKKLRYQISQLNSITNWKDFCENYVGDSFVNEWVILEQEFGLNFVEVFEGEVSELFNSPLRWSEMVRVMADEGLRGPDAMILNLFSNSKFPFLITNDTDFEAHFGDPSYFQSEKAIFIL